MTISAPSWSDRSVAYETIAQAIAFLQQNHLAQPDLATIAQQVHLSEYHFQRLFSEWVGISPKRFLQYLTVEYAKARICQSRSLTDLTLEVGLSSPGRLHDLFVSLEALSPGEFKAQGAGLPIRYGLHPSPFGACLIATTPRGICHLSFPDAITPQGMADLLKLEWPRAEIVADGAATAALVDRIFNPAISDPRPLVVLVKGTNFQIQVWRALLAIPSGSLTTYQQLATRLGQPTAARAVGGAVGRNAIAYLIPCHRVIRESGSWGGYRWGLPRKLAMVGWEASQQSDRHPDASAVH